MPRYPYRPMTDFERKTIQSGCLIVIGFPLFLIVIVISVAMVGQPFIGFIIGVVIALTACAKVIKFATVTKPDLQATKPTPQAAKSASRVKEAGPMAEWIALTLWEPLKATLPVTVMFLDGSRCELRRWDDLLPEVARWLWDSGHLTSTSLPVWSGHTRYIANASPTHSHRKAFTRPHRVNEELVVEKDTDGRDETRRFAIKLLEHCRVDPSSVLVR